MTPKKTVHVRRTLILDPINPRDYREFKIIHCCEDCSHFAPATETCTIGYEAFNHTAAKQKENYERLGKVAFCRFCEID